MKYRWYTLISMLAHILLLLSLSMKHGGDRGNAKSSQEDNFKPISVKIVESEKDDKKVTSKKDIAVKKKKHKKKPEEKHDCNDHYTGIGIIQGYDSCTVLKVFIGYPAFMNGVQVGDLIISPPCDQIRGPEGSVIDMKILRGTKVINLSFKRGKICGTRP